MEIYFNFNMPASGRNFIGRKKDVDIVTNLIRSGESIALYGEPHCGYSSLIKQSLMQLQLSSFQANVLEIDLLNCRTSCEVLSRYASSVMRLFLRSMEDIQANSYSFLDGSGWTVDEEAFYTGGDFFHFEGGKPDAEACYKVLSLPYKLADTRRTILYFKNFQNINEDSEARTLLKAYEELLVSEKGSCSAIFTGTAMNAMKEIFEVKRYFWKDVVIFPLSQISDAEIIEYVHKGFQNKGKVVERKTISEYVHILRNNMWYINTLFALTDYISVGYVVPKTLLEAMQLLLGLHKPRFLDKMASLTDFQISLLKAVVDGETHMSATGVVENYGLNSSANVKRLKDALIKKEVLWFDEKDEPHIQDALFEWWLRTEYFGVSEN